MIDAQHHFELNSVKYRAAEDAEGSHYELRGESLRPPNAQVVQGGDSATFQVRTDTLLWNISDWSGGEGQIKFDAQMSDRSYLLDNVDPFSEPGKLMLGPSVNEAQVQAGGDLGVLLIMTHAMDGLWGVQLGTNSENLYEWDAANDYWKNAVDNTHGDASRGCARGGVTGDAQKLYYIEDSTDNIFSYDGSAFVKLNNTTSATGNSPMVSFGDYLYVLDLVNWKIQEVSKTSVNVENELVDFSASETAKIDEGAGQLTVGDERVYFMQVLSDVTIIWEITPTTAAGTGFGKEVLRLEGIRGEQIWYHLGTLFISGIDNAGTVGNRAIMYWHPGGQFGTLGNVRKERGVTVAAKTFRAGNTGTLLTTAFFGAPSNAIQTTAASKTGVWIIDAVSGGFACVAVAGAAWASSAVEATVYDAIEYRGEYFWTVFGSISDVLRTEHNKYNTEVAMAETPIWTGMIAEEKVLESIQIITEPLGADTSVEIQYSVDNGANWVSAGTSATDNSTGETFVVSTDSTTRTFHGLKLRILPLTTNSARSPVILEVNVRASVLIPVRVWNLLLDLSDDQSGLAQSHAGSRKITNIKTLGATESVVDFKDGYQSRELNTYEQVDVRVDDYSIRLDRAGEGVALVRLVEVT